MKSGHFQPPVSRRTMARVLMHCMARTNQTRRLTATSGDQTGLPSGRRASRLAFAGAAVFAHGVGEVGGFFAGVADAVDDAHGGDEDLAGGEGADEADAHLPVV